MNRLRRILTSLLPFIFRPNYGLTVGDEPEVFMTEEEVYRRVVGYNPRWLNVWLEICDEQKAGSWKPRAFKVAEAMITLESDGIQPTAGKVQKQLGERVVKGGNLNGRDAAVFAEVMTRLGYERKHIVSPRANSWSSGVNRWVRAN